MMRAPDFDEEMDRVQDHGPDGAGRNLDRLRQPEAVWVRVPAGIALTGGGVLGFLPALGFWMLPIGPSARGSGGGWRARLPARARILDAADRPCAAGLRRAAYAPAAGPRAAFHQRQDRETKRAEGRKSGDPQTPKNHTKTYLNA